jgi:hypothetical protein
MDEKIITDLEEDISSVVKVKAHLNLLYYNPDFGTFFTRPVLSMLSAGCDYLSTNLNILKEKYRVK